MKKYLLYSVVLLVTVLLAAAAVADTPKAAVSKASPFEDPEPGGQLAPPGPALAPGGATGATITVPTDYLKIQDAIDAAATSGDLIVVLAGSYPEAIVIDGKSLTIQGAGATSTSITGTAGVTQYIVKITNGAVVDLSGFTIDGTGKTIQYGVYATAGTDGNIHDNDVKNISYPGAAGLAVRRHDSQIDVKDNNVYGFGRIGIYTRDDVILNTDGGVISGNTVTGLGGSDPNRLSYGISVYSGNPTVDDNEISGCVSGANVTAWASSAIDVWTGSASALTNNDIHDCDNGIISNSASPAMSGNTFYSIAYDNVRLDFMVKGNPTPSVWEYYNTIQAAIDAIPSTTYPCIVWIAVYSAGGTYSEAVNVNKPCAIYGKSRSTVTINPVGYAVNNSGIYVAANNVELYSFTLVGSTTNSLPRYGVKFANYDGCVLWDAEIRNFYRTGVDILGATNLTITDVYSHDNIGNGLQACDARDVVFSYITTSGNGWGGVGIFTNGRYTPIGTWGIVFSGTNSFGETTDDVGSIYLEEGNYATPSSPYPITYSTNILDAANVTVQLADVTHMLHGNSDVVEQYTRFYKTLADAQTAAASAVSHITDDRYIMELAGEDLYVPAYQGGIQAAIDAASPYDVIHVAAGMYDERIVVNKPLTLKGATNGVSKKGFAVPPLYAYDPLTQSIIKPSTDAGDVTVVQIAADEVVFDGFVVANEVCATGGVYRDLITINQSLVAPTGIQILNNVLGPNTNTLSQDGTMSRSGICAPGPRTNALKLIAKNNKIFDVKGNGCGIMIVGPYGPTYHGASYTNLYSGSVIENNEITGNHRSGIELAAGVQGGTATADYFKIWNNLITNNGWFSLADKNNLKYGHGIMFIRGGTDRVNCDASGSRFISLERNVITGNEKSGVYVGPMNKDLFWSNNTIANNGLGTGGYNLWDGVRVDLAESYYAPGTACTNYGYLTNIPFSNNSLSGNGVYGMQVIQTPTLGPVNASYNWWGDVTGPYHNPLNLLGLGNDVSDNVTFTPYMTGEYEISVVPAYGITNCSTPIMYTYHITQAGAGTPIRGYDVKFDVDNAVVTVAVPASDVTQLSYLSSVGGTSFYVLDNTGGTYTVSCAILGTTVGRTGDGDLFTVTLTPLAQGTSAIAMVSLKLRNLNNQPIPVGGAGGSIQIDCTLPTMEAIAEAQNACYKVAPRFSNFGFDDDVNLDLADYQIDALGWTPIFSGINAMVWDSDGWALPGFGTLSEGSHTVYFRVKDDAGNWNAGTLSWAFVKDTVAPAAPTNLVALPGHNKVHLTWTNSTDPSWVGVKIRRIAWGDYPQYNTPGVPDPGYPADSTGVLVAQTALAAYDDATMTGRDIYNYAVFSYDCAGNYSVASSTAQDRSTSYWLGDISPQEGKITLQDLSAFALTFGQVQVLPPPPPAPVPQWNPEGDFGPTDDWSRFGIPMPDNVVDFEDLMIFAMNYLNVDPLGTSGALIALAEAVPLGEQVSFRLVLVSREDGKATYAVIVENASEVLKGFSLKLACGAGNALESVTSSRGLTGKGSEHFFGVIERESGVVEICVAALGVNSPFEYTGEVARVVVREETPGAVQLKTVDLRDINNGRDEIVLPGNGGETPFIPVTMALMQNHPNPFNPTTTIAFDVATAGDVRIEIYDVSGSLVRALVNGSKGVGRHVAIWDGHDSNGNQVHTGVYFYRMTAPGYTSQAKKMLLLK